MTNICPNNNCNKDFIYLSELKRHLNNSYHCGKDIEDIDFYILQKKTTKKTEEKTCMYCNTTYSKKSSLDRHIKNSQCSIEFKELKRQQQIEDLKNEIEKLKLQLQVQNTVQQPIQQEQIQQQIVQQQIVQQNQIQQIRVKRKKQIHPVQAEQVEQAEQPVHLDHNNIQQPNQTINHINNNLTINNNNNNITIINHINPAGFETLPDNLNETEMLRLLNLEDKGVIEIVKLVCEQNENKNFYKLNMNKNNISYLNNNYKIDICQDKELKEKLLKQCVILTYRMLIACSSLMTSEQIYTINSNLQNISQKMKEEIFDNGLKNIIEYELRNNSKLTKDKINKYTKEIVSNHEIKEQAINNYNKVLQIKEDTSKHKNPMITLYDINNKLGDPISSQYLEKDFTFNEFNTKRYEYTTYNKYWLRRIKDEFKYIDTHPNKTIGDITYYENRKKEIYENIEKMKTINSQMREFDTNNNLLITYDNFNVEIANDYIKENERIKTQHLLNSVKKKITT
jgi:hypothetical protein